MNTIDARRAAHLGRVDRRRWLLSAAACALAVPAHAATYRVGINAGVSFNETEDQQRLRYAALLDSLGRAVGQKLDFGVVYSDRVARALEPGAHDFLLIHTHAALRAERDARWRLLALSNDRKDNTLHFFVRPESPVTSLQQLGSLEIGSPGLQSWATATARAVLKAEAPAITPRFRPTRLQEVVPYMVELRAVGAGVCRSKAVVDESVAAGRIRVIHTTAPMPLYALIASPEVPVELGDRLRQQAQTVDTLAYDRLPLRGLSYATADAGQLRGFFGA